MPLHHIILIFVLASDSQGSPVYIDCTASQQPVPVLASKAVSVLAWMPPPRNTRVPLPTLVCMHFIVTICHIHVLRGPPQSGASNKPSGGSVRKQPGSKIDRQMLYAYVTYVCFMPSQVTHCDTKARCCWRRESLYSRQPDTLPAGAGSKGNVSHPL